MQDEELTFPILSFQDILIDLEELEIQNITIGDLKKPTSEKMMMMIILEQRDSMICNQH